MKIKIYNTNMRPLGSTSRAFNVEKLEELMREYTLSFSVLNNDSVFKYLNENTVFEFAGQLFDVAGIDGSSGKENKTDISAEHVSYRLADYTVPNGYAFVGTISEIANDILAEAKTVDGTPANTVFSIGKTADKGTVTYSIGDEKNVTARQALIGMAKLGVEVRFDNFTIDVPERIGKDSGIKFEYGVNLNGVRRTWQRDNGWSYEIDIVDLQKQPGYEGAEFSIGDTVTVIDKQQNITLFNQQVISYRECDDPRQNKITIGVFVRDNATLSIETDATAKSANETAKNSVQQGTKYSNVSITHAEGVVATNQAGTQRVVMNSQDCFAVQIKSGDEWVTVNSVQTFGMVTPRLTTDDAMNAYYATVGLNENGNPGLFLYINYNGAWLRHFEIWPSYDSDGNLDGSTIDSTYGDIVLRSKKNVYIEAGEGSFFGFVKGNKVLGNTDIVDVGVKKLEFEDGLFVGASYGESWSGTVPLGTGYTLVFENGVLVDVKGE